MTRRIQFLTCYGLCWTVLFQLFRILFLIYHNDLASDLPIGVILDSILHGLRMDISFACYILMMPAVLCSMTSIKWNWYKIFLYWYSGVICIIISLLTVFDLELFKAWGFRIDATVLGYIKTPAEAIASMGAAPILLLSVLLVVVFAFSFGILFKVQNRLIPRFSESSFAVVFPSFLVVAASLVIPIRGGLQLAPMNESAVFFSDNSFANHAAVNVPWSFSNSILRTRNTKSNPFVHLDQQQAEYDIAALLKGGSSRSNLIRVGSKPVNVIVIVWESLTAKVVAGLGGVDATPEFDRLSKEGILFTRMYASGNRSDKGIVSILSGYPAQPITSIVKIPKKTASLPSLPRACKNDGYSTSFYYGGETEFANMKSYFLQQGFDKIVDKNAFSEADMNSKWGAHDHVVLNRLLTDLDKQKEPFFSTLFTLSSHEPFDVPMQTLIPGSDPTQLFLNAHRYSDQSVGDFIRKAKTKPWWDNTLIVILADHGHPLPQTNDSRLEEFHIPMLWLGGVLRAEGARVDTLCSQIDLASTLLNEIGIKSTDFEWSNDILRIGRQSFAYFAFNNGFGWVRPEWFLVHDNIGKHVIEKSVKLGVRELKYGRSYLQTSFQDYLNR